MGSDSLSLFYSLFHSLTLVEWFLVLHFAAKKLVVSYFCYDVSVKKWMRYFRLVLLDVLRVYIRENINNREGPTGSVQLYTNIILHGLKPAFDVYLNFNLLNELYYNYTMGCVSSQIYSLWFSCMEFQWKNLSIRHHHYVFFFSQIANFVIDFNDLFLSIASLNS